MGAFVDEIGDLKAATGKPARLGGIPHETGTTGFGVGVTIDTVLGCVRGEIPLPESLSDAKVAIQGFGNVGSELAKYLYSKGAKVVAVSDYWSAIYDKNGLDVDKLVQFAYAKNAKQSVGNYKNADRIQRDSIYGIECDFFVPAAHEKVLTMETISQLKTKVIVEAANCPTTWEAERSLHKRGILLMPDLLANAGGVIGSYVEYKGGNVDEAFSLIDSKIRMNTSLVVDRSLKTGTMPRIVAMDIAMERVNKAMQRTKTSQTGGQ
jgi:glutamate dehydrogenase (NAD(P)+)